MSTVSATRSQPPRPRRWADKRDRQLADHSGGWTQAWIPLGIVSLFFSPLRHQPAFRTSCDVCLQLSENRKWGDSMSGAPLTLGLAAFSVWLTAQPAGLSDPLLFVGVAAPG